MGLLIAVIFSAAMSSSSGEINSLATVSVIDIYRLLHQTGRDSTALPLGFAAIHDFLGRIRRLVCEFVAKFRSAHRSREPGRLILLRKHARRVCACFFLKEVRGTAAFWAVIIGQSAIFLTSRLTHISYLWFNVIGCVVVVTAALLLTAVIPRERGL